MQPDRYAAEIKRYMDGLSRTLASLPLDEIVQVVQILQLEQVEDVHLVLEHVIKTCLLLSGE